jgi:chitodextrinase
MFQRKRGAPERRRPWSAAVIAGLVATTLVVAAGPARADAGTRTVTFTGDYASVFPNPDRGFHNRYEIINDPAVNDYATNNSIAGFSPDMLDRTFARAKADGDTLIHSYVHLDKYQTSPLPQELLDNLSSGLAAIRASGMKIVLRFAYTWDSYPNVTEAQIEAHIAQLAPVLNANADVIDHFEAGFLGMWGEWHDSAYTDPFNATQAEARYRVIKTEMDDFPPSVPIAVRYPIFNYEFLQRTTPPPNCVEPNNCLLTQAQKDRLGFHDDCFLSDSADMGTYDQNSWLGWFDVTTKKQWVYSMATSTGGNQIVGGETCDSAGADDSAGVNAQYELSHQHWSEINEDYAPVNINIWKAANLAASGNDPAETLFTRAKRLLGYRLRLVDATMSTTATPGQAFTFAAHLNNDGYAGPIQQRPIYLVFDDGTHRYDVPMPGIDVRTWLSGAVTVPTQTVTLPGNMVAGNYTVALWLPDQYASLHGNPAYDIRLANVGTWNATTGYNVLATGVTVGTCPGDCTPPSTPTLSSPSHTSTSVTLSWTAATDNVGVTGYDVYRGGTKIATVTTTGYTDSGLSPGAYSYTVVARDAAGNTSPASNAVAVSVGCTDCSPPSTPGNVVSTAQTSSSITLSWTASTDNVGVAGYQVYRGSTLVGSPTGTTYTDTGLTASTAYTYTVTAKDAAGNTSAASSPLTVSTTAPAPVGLVLDDFDGTPAYPSAALNDLGKWTGGNCFLNGGGAGVESGGALSLQYNNCGWFGSDVNTDLSAYTYLVVRIKGAAGGEQTHFNVNLGGATKVFGDFTLDGGGHPVITTAYQDIKIPMVANGMSRSAPGQLAMGFWYGGAGTISIDSISFQ